MKRIRPSLKSSIVSVGSVTLLACRGTDLPSDREWESDHFRYHTRDADSSVCQDVLAPLEEHFSALQSFIRFPWPDSEKIDYYKFTNSKDAAENSDCDDEEAACTDHTAVEASTAFQTHELIHAYLSHVGFPPWLLLEGAAVALSCHLAMYPRPVIGWRDAFGVDRSGSNSADLYGAGAWLVGHLVTNYSPTLLLDLYRAVPRDAHADQFASAVESVYGSTLDALWDAAVQSLIPPAVCPWECSQPSFSIGSPAESSPTTCGSLKTIRTFSIAEESTLVVNVATNASVSLGTCSSGVPTFRGSVSGQDGGSSALYRLVPGGYFLAYNASDNGSSAPFTARLASSKALISDLCDFTSEAIILNTKNLRIDAPVVNHPWFLPLNPTRSGTLWASTTDSPVVTSICDSCSPANCRNLPMYTVAPITQLSVVMFESDPSAKQPYDSTSLTLTVH